MKKLLSILLSVIMLTGAVPAVYAEEAQEKVAAPSFKTDEALYVHAVVGSDDTQAWQKWQSVHDTDLKNLNDQSKYFFLPSSASDTQVDIYNAFNTDVSVNGVTISKKETATVSYNTTDSFQVNVNGTHNSLRFMRSNAEAAIYINNTNIEGNASGEGTYLMDYLTADKSRSAEADGAIVSPDGTIDNTSIKKIKGRGNSTWNGVTKKSFNITYKEKVSVGGMSEGKKYSLLANYQDDSLSRNRFLYDLADAVDIPYSSDSRYVDFYSNGFYWGSYQMCQKVDVGSSELISDFSKDTDYLNADKETVKEDFPFLCEVDSKATEGEDYFVKCKDDLKITIKWPEPASNTPAYEQVKNYVRDKFNEFYSATTNNGDISRYADVDSITKLYLINELGKNWDSGTSSLYFVYKPDDNGNYKFYGSPVWDYDNSLGNAKGVADDLGDMGVDDYTLPTGWWCKFKGKSINANYTVNIMNRISRNHQIMAAAPRIWFESFLPAIDHFTGNTKNKNMDKEIYTSEKYLELVKNSAYMNYTSGWSRKINSDWIANHNIRMKKSEFNKYTGEYTESGGKDEIYYTDSFEGAFKYAADWLNNRAAWLSNEFYKYYSFKPGDVDLNNVVDIRDATEIQKYLAKFVDFYSTQCGLADYDSDGDVTVNDATFIQYCLAALPNCDPPEQEAVSVNYEKTLSNEYKVLFTNSLYWEGPIYCYYWRADNDKMCTWPGLKMDKTEETNRFGQYQYEFAVPEDAEYVIFNNGYNGINQTVNILLDRSVTGYYAENYIEISENYKNKYRYKSWNINE